MTAPGADVTPTRRQVVTALCVGGAAATSGCFSRVRNVVGREAGEQVSLSIKTEPADSDPYAISIAREISGWFREVGIQSSITPMGSEELRRQVLLNREFEVFVMRVPVPTQTPDMLYPRLHSNGVSALGWRNPFGYTNLRADQLLGDQRQLAGTSRHQTVSDLLWTVARTQPFSVVCAPEAIRAVRTNRFEGWQRTTPKSPTWYLAIERTEQAVANGVTDLRMVTTDGQTTGNLNPLAVEFRERGTITGLLYDPLVRLVDGERSREIPWLAESVTFADGIDRPRATVQLRPDAVWHDGTPMTASDVAFTYDFLQDTTLETAEYTVSAPRFGGRAGLVAGTDVIDDRTVEFEFVNATRPVARRAFTVPILPEHVWRDRTDAATVAGLEVDGRVTEALVTGNVPAVGSGPLRHSQNASDGALVLERFEDHFLADEPSNVPAMFTGGPDFERLVVTTVGSDPPAVARVASGDVDVTDSTLGTGVVPEIGRDGETTLLVTAPDSFYLVGYNARRQPLSNPRFRNALGRMIDERYLVDTVFDGYAQPATTLLDGTDWCPADLEYDDGDRVTPFQGTDGQLETESARETFRSVGYNYNDEGRLVVR